MRGEEGSDPFAEVNAPEFLARLVKGGAESQKAFGQLVRVTHDRFLAFVRRSLSSSDECQEVVQEMYLAVHKGLSKFEGKSKLTTWMYSLAHYKICDKLAEKDRAHQELTESNEAVLITGDYSDSFDPVTPWDASADHVLARSSVESLIVEAVKALPPLAREIYQLRDVDGLSGEDAAAVLEMPPVNVRVQLHRARTFIVRYVQEKMKDKSVQRGASRS